MMSLDPCMPHYSTTQSVSYSDIGLVRISFLACCVSHNATGLPTGMSTGPPVSGVKSALTPTLCGSVPIAVTRAGSLFTHILIVG